jgi:hypothetical protein
MKLEEAERQMVLLALARLSIERPGWDAALNRLAMKIDNDREGRAEMYDAFRKLGRDTAWHRVLDNAEEHHG